MRYVAQVCWAGCDVSDILSELACEEKLDAQKLVQVLQLADGQPHPVDGTPVKLSLVLTDTQTGKKQIADRHSGWTLR